MKIKGLVTLMAGEPNDPPAPGVPAKAPVVKTLEPGDDGRTEAVEVDDEQAERLIQAGVAEKAVEHDKAKAAEEKAAANPPDPQADVDEKSPARPVTSPPAPGVVEAGGPRTATQPPGRR